MIRLLQEEIDALHAKDGTRQEFYKLELLDRKGIKKCDLELKDGSIDISVDAPISKAGNIEFMYPDETVRIETTPPNTNPVISSASASATNYELGTGTNGRAYTLKKENEVSELSVTSELSVAKIKVNSDGRLYIDDTAIDGVAYYLTDTDGYTWEVGVINKRIYNKKTDERKLYYEDRKIEVNYLTDRLKPYMGIRIGDKEKWWPLGVYLMCCPIENSGFVKSRLLDELVILQQDRPVEPQTFIAGTNYTEVLRSILINAKIIKINIQATTLVLPTDITIDDTKNRLEWFNYIAEQINYSNVWVDADGWFRSEKYIEPSNANVQYKYNVDKKSVIVGTFDTVMDNWNIPNVFKRVVSHPQLGAMVCVLENDNPTDPYSTVNRNRIVDSKMVDSAVNYAELEAITRKAMFKAKQVSKEVSFPTLNMPHHAINDVIEVNGEVYVEQKWQMQLKAGATMTHSVKRLVNIK